LPAALFHIVVQGFLIPPFHLLEALLEFCVGLVELAFVGVVLHLEVPDFACTFLLDVIAQREFGFGTGLGDAALFLFAEFTASLFAFHHAAFVFFG